MKRLGFSAADNLLNLMRTLLARLRMFRGPAGCDSSGVKRAVSRESGQAVVETAIVLPLFTFILLGILQIMLMHQARLMTRYAAYKAARAGSIGSANHKRMTNAALSVLIPLISKGNNGATHATGNVFHVTDGSSVVQAFQQVRDNQNGDASQLPYVEVMVCSPNKGLLKNAGDEMDFDGKDTVTGQDWEGFDKTRLSIQVTFNYRMVVPFANMLIWHMAYGSENMDMYRAYRLGLTPRQVSDLANKEKGKYSVGHTDGVYIFPIRANWAMRMQSNLFPNASGDYQLPDNNDCIVRFPKKGGGGGAAGQVGQGGDDDSTVDDDA
jgi:Flp pilus assembly protein TadG